MSRRIACVCAVLLALLAAPPAHAAYSPATTDGWIVVAGRAVGFAGAQFRTDVWLFNPSADSFANVALLLHPQVASGGPPAAPIRSGTITLAPRETRYLPDVTLSTIPADGIVGAIEWQSDLPVLVSSRNYTAPSGCTGGTFGAFVPGLPATEALPAKTSSADSVNVLQMYGLNTGDPDYRINLDILNASPVSLVVEVRVIDPVTTQIYGGVRTYQIAAASLLRLIRITEIVGAPLLDGLRITVAVKEGQSVPSGGVFAMATTLDNRSQDAFAFLGQRQSASLVPTEALPAIVLP